MANVVLKDNSGDEQTYENVEAVVLNTDTGETETFVATELIPQSDWAQTDSTATDYIKNKPDLAEAATSGDYNDLENTPCGTYPALEETTPELNYDEEPQCYGNAISEKWKQVDIGVAYTVVWDGTEYACTVKEADSDTTLFTNFRYLGNPAQVYNIGAFREDVLNTGEPFVLFWPDNAPNTFYLNTNAEGSHTLSVMPVSSVRPLAESYLPSTAATKSWVNSQIANSSGTSGGSTEALDTLLQEQELSGFAYDSDMGNYASLIIFDSLEQAFFLKAGETYRVSWDGESYDCVAQDLSEIVGTKAIAVGDCTAFGGSGNGEPFTIAYVPASFCVYVLAGTDASEAHTVGIYQYAASGFSIPTVDMTEQGLSAVPTDGTIVTAQSNDAIEMVKAFQNGIATLFLILTDGSTEMSVTLTCNTTVLSEGDDSVYEAHGIIWDFNSILHCTVFMQGDYIGAFIKPIVSASLD